MVEEKQNGAGKPTPYCLLLLDGPLDLVGAEASGTSVHMARSSVDNRLNPLYVGLPGTVGASVGVGNLNTESYTLATKITLSHSLHLLSERIINILLSQSLRYDSRVFKKKQVFFCFFLKLC